MSTVVDVDDEPRHVELFRNEHVRAYLATIEPGECTLYHRHRFDTLYTVVTGGVCRSQEPGRQRNRTRTGRSTGTGGTLALLLRRTFLGSLRLRTGTVLIQYHRDFPLTHRLCAYARNPDPIRMLGIELHGTPGRAAAPVSLPVEYRDHHATTYRTLVPAGARPAPLGPVPPGLLALLSPAGEVQLRWVDGDLDLANPGPAPLDALLVVLDTG